MRISTELRGDDLDRRQTVLSRLDAIIETLSCVPQDEIDVGWDPPRVKNWIGVFSNLREMVAQGKPLLPRYKNAIYVRGLNMDGIGSGRVFDMVLKLDFDLEAIP
jgi:hypothetical protein